MTEQAIIVQPKFKGELVELNGNMFQLRIERGESQFQDMMEALRVYVSTEYCSNIRALAPLFSDLEE